jgi:hypothetical protein
LACRTSLVHWRTTMSTRLLIWDDQKDALATNRLTTNNCRPGTRPNGVYASWSIHPGEIRTAFTGATYLLEEMVHTTATQQLLQSASASLLLTCQPATVNLHFWRSIHRVVVGHVHLPNMKGSLSSRSSAIAEHGEIRYCNL